MKMAKPGGLKVYPTLLSDAEIKDLLHKPEFAEQAEAHVELFRLYGEFGFEQGRPAPTDWMLEWGERLTAQGVCSQVPNQYRVCDWVGDLKAQFKWHIDNARHGAEILAICVTGPRRIGFRKNASDTRPHILELEAGDAYMMRRASRWNWEHCVMPAGEQGSGGKSLIMSYRRS